MVKREGTVKNAYGIHCRPSAEVAKAVKKYKGKLEISNSEGKKADPRSVLALLSLTLTCGDKFSIVVDGPDEEAICDMLMSFMEKEYDFQR
ncbi:MAG: HPr family phosphocarrier protein [Victivallales bacterium]|jgi:phosphotransferase system HPr (HPr) family protein|nr:HPr family phosphocarrier protein [Victivallales bacterium]MBR4220262.1 HPr family phosphocarrier protein [Victivallales bacterium]